MRLTVVPSKDSKGNDCLVFGPEVPSDWYGMDLEENGKHRFGLVGCGWAGAPALSSFLPIIGRCRYGVRRLKVDPATKLPMKDAKNNYVPIGEIDYSVEVLTELKRTIKLL